MAVCAIVPRGRRFMLEKLKGLSQVALGLVIVLALLAVPILFIMGAAWAAKHLLQPLIAVAWIVLAIDLLVLVFALIPHFRGIAGTILVLSSYLFGLVTWLFAFVVTYAFWGL